MKRTRDDNEDESGELGMSVLLLLLLVFCLVVAVVGRLIEVVCLPRLLLFLFLFGVLFFAVVGELTNEEFALLLLLLLFARVGEVNICRSGDVMVDDNVLLSRVGNEMGVFFGVFLGVGARCKSTSNCRSNARTAMETSPSQSIITPSSSSASTISGASKLFDALRCATAASTSSFCI